MAERTPTVTKLEAEKLPQGRPASTSEEPLSEAAPETIREILASLNGPEPNGRSTR
jgi:hypothetical protein